MEHPVGGDPLRRFGTPTARGDTLTWMSEGRNKKSVTVDLHRPDGVEIFKSLVEKSDVVCENFRPEPWKNGGLAGKCCAKSIRG